MSSGNPFEKLEQTLGAQATEARLAARRLRLATRAEKDACLTRLATRLRDEARSGSTVLAANEADVALARSTNQSPALIERLILNEERLLMMSKAVAEIASLEDPVGEVVNMVRRPNGLSVGQVRIPLGVIAMIYEARPNVTVDAAALCVKSGNTVLLRGGKEAANSNAALGELVRGALVESGLPESAVQIIAPGGRDEIRALVSLTGQIDLVIPRGGEGLIRFVKEHATVPVIEHYKGVCHLYVDAGADLDMAFRLIENGKMQRPGVCNALECVLVHEAVAGALFPRLDGLIGRGLAVRGDPRVCALLKGATPVQPEDYGQEFLAPVLAAKVVGSLDEALDHIATFGSQHTESICTRDYDNSQRFLREVDASCVVVNASTRFNDGGQLGLGAEIGISTTKLHAYGPMGLTSLTALKWIVYGEGQTRD